MDAFRRFRSRRKSKGQADVFTTFGDAESNYRPGSSPWQNSSLKSPVTATRPSDVGTDRKLSHEQFRQPTSPISQRSPGTVGRAQPLLVGISKPFADSRPGTADSMQRALDRAADSVKLNRSFSPQSSHLTQKPARYIDIFAISEQAAHPTNSYNEDVAARNIDTVALTIEGQHYRYEPGSKYQEEVAARNAHPSPSTHIPLLRGPPNNDRKQSFDERPSSSHSGTYPYQPLVGDTTRSRRAPENSNNRPVQIVSHGREHRDQLPVIPQERSSEDFGVEDESESIAQKDEELENAQLRWLEARRQRLGDYLPNTEKPLPASPRRQETLRDSGISSNTDNTKRTSGISDQSNMRPARGGSVTGSHHSHRKPGVLEPSAYLVATPPKQVISVGQDLRADRTSDGSRQYERLRPQSNTSSASAYKRVMVGNRTIMDLTGEEDPDVVSVVSYMPTPVIENARLDAIEKVVPTMVDHSPPPRLEEKERDQAVPNARWSSALEPVLNLDQLARRSQAISEAARALHTAKSIPQTPLPEIPRVAPAAPVPAPAPALTFSGIQTWTSAPPSKVITFSPINTLTSTSPRNSQDLNGSERRRRDGQRNDGTSINQTSSLSVSSRANPRLSANIAPLVKVFADVRPEVAVTPATTEIKKQELSRPMPDRKTSSDHSVSSKKRGKMRERFEEKESIRQAAKSIIPAGPIDQEPLPGVKTRDFAAMPIEKPTNKRVEALSERKKSYTDSRPGKDQMGSERLSPSEKKSRPKPSRSASKTGLTDTSNNTLMPIQPVDKKQEKKSGKKSSKSGSSSARKSRPKSVFDEAAFQKKHAEANAALLRLQQSLQEPFEETMSQSDTPRDTLTPAERAFSPSESRATPQPSPSAAAAIAMITAATSSPRSTPRPILSTQTSSATDQRPREMQSSSSQSNFESSGDQNLKMTTLKIPPSASYPQMAYNPILGRLESSSKPPPSPGEVSLSAFPIPTPTPRAMSPASARGPPAYVKDVGGPVRRGSQSSRISSASAFSIPFTMVPNRTGSLLENRLGTLVPSASTHVQMNSIDAIVPSIKASGMASP